MEILIVTPFKDHAGGVETINKTLENTLIALGHGVSYFTLDKKLENLSPIEKVRVKIFGLSTLIQAEIGQVDLDKYDLVIANGEFAKGIRHKRCVTFFHGSYAGLSEYLRPYQSLKQRVHLYLLHLEQKGAAKQHIVATVSPFAADILERHGIKVDTIILNSVDCDYFAPSNVASSTKSGYLFVGSDNYIGKGFDILEDLARRIGEIHCVTSRKVHSPLIQLPLRKNEEMLTLYQKTRYFIFPSRYEAGAVSVLEAMATGTPVICSHVGYGAMIEKEIPEFVVSTKDPREYQKRIQIIEERYDEFSKRAREYVLKHHSPLTYRARWKEFLEVIC